MERKEGRERTAAQERQEMKGECCVMSHGEDGIHIWGELWACFERRNHRKEIFYLDI